MVGRAMKNNPPRWVFEPRSIKPNREAAVKNIYSEERHRIYYSVTVPAGLGSTPGLFWSRPALFSRAARPNIYIFNISPRAGGAGVMSAGGRRRRQRALLARRGATTRRRFHRLLFSAIKTSDRDTRTPSQPLPRLQRGSPAPPRQPSSNRCHLFPAAPLCALRPGVAGVGVARSAVSHDKSLSERNLA